jgi:HD-like signal output (HDOD) protein
MAANSMPGLGSKVFQDVFQYIPEKKFVYIYNAGRQERYDRGEILVREGGKDETVYLVLEGEFRLYKTIGDRELTMAVLKPGDWIGEMGFHNGSGRVASAVAEKASNVLAVDSEVFATMDHETQASLLKRFNRMASERMDFLLRQQLELLDQQRRLISIIKSTLNTEKYIYSESELIRSFIQVIPRLPVYAVNLITMLNDSSVSMEEISRIIRQDPTLAAQVLRVANSPYYGFPNKIRDIQHSLAMLGLNQVYLLVTFYAVRSTMPKTKEFSQLQVHSVVMSYVASEMAASSSDSSQMAMVGTLGLLHDIGRSVIMLLKQNHPESSLLFDTFDHHLMGGLLLKSWNLPEEICESIRYQSYFKFASPQDIPEEYRRYVAILGMSHLVTEAIRGGRDFNDSVPFLQSYQEELNLFGYSIEELAKVKIMPDLKRKWRTLPVIVRNYLSEG